MYMYVNVNMYVHVNIFMHTNMYICVYICIWVVFTVEQKICAFTLFVNMYIYIRIYI